MNEAVLQIDAGALARNWRALAERCSRETGAVVKADAYGLGVGNVAPVLWREGARVFFVANLAEAIELRAILPEALIYEFSGQSVFAQAAREILPVINTLEQYHALDGRDFALQFNTGMNRLGIDAADLAALDRIDLPRPRLVLSHLACADEPKHAKNEMQLKKFHEMRSGFEDVPASLSATGGILLGADYHFDLCRPGIGIYGGAPFLQAEPVMQIALPVLQERVIGRGEAVGYGGQFVAQSEMRIATVFGGYADGISRILSGRGNLYAGATPCPLLGRVSMDAATVDISALDEVPAHLELLRPEQDINLLADRAETIAYELFTSLGKRYKRNVI